MVADMDSMTILGVIPARYESSRFKGKPLTIIDGIPMIRRTYNQAKKSTSLDALVVATDDLRIADYCKGEDIPFIMTSTSCLTGTDRLAEVSESLNYDLYINIQGDEPIIDPKGIDQIIDLHKNSDDSYHIYNLYKVITDPEEINSRTIIKVVVNEYDDVMYMSRLPIPYSNTEDTAIFKQQIPIYGFTRHALDLFSRHTKTLNEKYEDIELLRFMDLGLKIKMMPTSINSIAVDVPSDVVKVERFLREHQLQ